MLFRITFLCFTLFIGGAAFADSLFSEDEYTGLAEDKRSIKVGDIITVLIYETASSVSSTSTTTKKSVDNSAKIIEGVPGFNGGLGVSSEFDGGGSSSQKGQLAASVSVTVIDKLRNGDLVVAGEQRLKFNNDSQFISVKGRVRADDVSPENSVLSTRLADAKIEFTGEGLLASRSKPGIFTRFFNWLF